MNIKRIVLRCSAIATLLAGVAGTAAAQNVLEEITVTAQKREQDIQDVGIAITAFTGAQMQALGVEQSFDIAAFTPGVHISGNLAGQNTQFTIRGVTQNDFNDIVEAPNATYLDAFDQKLTGSNDFALEQQNTTNEPDGGIRVRMRVVALNP